MSTNLHAVDNPLPNKISDEYLTLLRNSRKQLEQAHVTNQFIERNLAAAYSLASQDEINLDTGEIVRKAAS